MPVNFTHREIQNAWRQNLEASKSEPRSNAHRLLLFYAVECGLKAILMRRGNCDRTDRLSPQTKRAQHHINRLLDCLRAGDALKLPEQVQMNGIRDRNGRYQPRGITPGEINQLWRYGGKAKNVSDESLEKSLLRIVNWIQRELS